MKTSQTTSLQTGSRWAAVMATGALLTGLCGHANAAAPFVVNNVDGTVTDTTTGLVWDQCSYGLSGTFCASGTALLADWPTALTTAATANAANYKGFNDWRVPNVKELESIVKIDTFNPAIDSAAFPATPLTGDSWGYGGVWSSTSFAPNPVGAWFVGFGVGRSSADDTTGTGYVRLVRSGQSLAAFDLLGAPPPVAAVTAIPTLSEWGAILLSGLVALFGLGRVRRQAQARR